MYCKQCGHRSDEKTEMCAKCGAKLLSSDVEFVQSSKPRIRWYVPAIAAALASVAFAVLPRYLLRSEMESIGPTDKLRFLRALDKSEYRRVGQTGFRLEGQTLVVLWDLRWKVLPEAKQLQIVRIVGKAWQVVGGENTRFRIEGEEMTVAEYKDGNVSIE